MKKIVKSFILVAAAAMGFTACQKEMQENLPVNGDAVQVTFVAASADTKTSVDTSGEDKPVFSWGENETFAVLEQTDALAAATSVTYEKVDGKAKITATFDANAGKGQYQYATIYPASGYVSAKGLAEATLSLPATQTVAENSYDPAADLMVSEVVTATAQPTEAQMVGFTRVAAVVKMTLKNLAVDAGDKVQSVTFAADGKVLAGNIVADLTSPKDFVAGTVTSNSVTVSTNSSSDVYFTVLPAVLEAGTAYTVAVTTDKKLYVKQGQIPEGKTLEFQRGMVNRFGVDMGGVAASDKWVLVKDASTLKEGDVVTIVAKDYDKAISTKLYSNASETSTSAKRGLADITKLADYIIGGEDLQAFTLVTGTVDGTFSFYDEAREKFLVSTTSSSTYLINQVYCDVNTSFKITIDGETTAATITNIEGEYKDNLLRYNSNGYFVSNKNTSTTYKDVCIYKLEGAEGEIPVVAAHVKVPDSDESVVIAEEGAVKATAISDVVFNYVGGWNISASAEAEWLDVAYDAVNNCLTYTAEPNTDVNKRQTSVTIKASLEGQDDITWPSFTVIQKGAPHEISIAEFKNKGKDVNTVYRLTGKIKEIPSSTSGKWKIVDENENEAQIQYLKTESGSYVKGNVDVEVGDVITITTVVASTTTGLGGNSSYPAIYKGHYTLEATASGSVGYEGGSTTINVELKKFGHVVASPTSISDVAVDVDGNLVSDYRFTDNGNGTATAILSFGENTTGGSRKVDLSFSAGSPLVVKTTITVMQDVNPSLKKGWWLVTDVADLEAGDKIIIAATGLDYAISTATNTNNRKSTAITKNGAALENVSTSVQQYALEIDTNGLYSFKGTLGSDADKYIYASSSSSNYMKVISTLDDNGKWTISIDSEGAATIVAQGTNTRNQMQYNNVTTSAPAFYCTDGSYGAVCLYKYYE